MKIAIVLGAFYFVPPLGSGAVEKRWLATAEALAVWGHSVLVFYRRSLEKPQHCEGRDIALVPVDGFKPSRTYPLLLLKDLIYSCRALRAVPSGTDLLVTNTFWLPILAGYFRKAKIYVDVSRFPKGQMGFYKRAVRLRVPSNAMAKAISRQTPFLNHRVKVIPNPLSFPFPESRVGGRENVILYLGRLHPEKGVDLLIRSFKSLLKRGFGEWRLCLVGPWEAQFGGGGEAFFKTLKSLTEGVEDQVEWAGRATTREALAGHYRRAGLFVYPSLAEKGESFGMAPLEAMSFGVPVLVSSLECFSDFITPERTGFAFDHRAPDPELALTDAMARCLESENLRVEVGEAATHRAREFDLVTVTCAFLEDFDSLMNEDTCAGGAPGKFAG